MNEDPNDSWQAPPAAPLPIAQPPRRGGVRRKTAVMATLVGLAGGGVVGGYMVARAATPSPSPSAPSSSSSSGAAATATPRAGDADGPGTPGGSGGGARLGGFADATEDPQTIATAIGITPAQLQTELQADGTIAAVAKAHNVDPAKVVSALVAAKTKEIDAALAAGTLTQAQADSARANAQQEATDQVNNTHAEGGRGGEGHHGGMQSEDLTVAAGALNITVAELQTDLQNGQTIATVAKARSVDVNTVISALVASENKEIDARVTSAQLTQAQADAQKQQTGQRVTDEVDGTYTEGGPGDNDAAAPGSSSSSSSSTSSAGV